MGSHGAALGLALTIAAGAAVPWPHGDAPDPRAVEEQLTDELEVADLERFEEFRAAAEEGESSEHLRVFQDRIDRGDYDLTTIFRMGDSFFDHSFVAYDGLGPSKAKGFIHRVHDGVRGGLDAYSCSSCHSVGGVDGAGSEPENAHIEGDGVHVSSTLVRNAPSVLGAGFVQSLGWDMTRELHALRTWNLDEAKRTGQERTFTLATKGVDYGKLTVFPDGRVDTSKVVGIDADLVVKPFGWKGNTARLRRFVEEASRIHFGVQSTILVEKHKLTPDVARLGNGKDWFDPDGDGITKELPEGVLTTGAVYMAMLESPVILPPHDESLRERWARGSVVFDSLGCASCHRKELVLTLGMNWEEKPDLSDKVVAVDLVKDGDPPKTGRNVRLFSDLKRHDMGAELADRHPSSDGVPVREWLTRPLWGLAESPPYMHDGRAATIPAAILAHGGEGEAAKLAFERASDSDRKDLHVYLLSLSREPHLRVIR